MTYTRQVHSLHWRTSSTISIAVDNVQSQFSIILMIIFGFSSFSITQLSNDMQSAMQVYFKFDPNMKNSSKRNVRAQILTFKQKMPRSWNGHLTAPIFCQCRFEADLRRRAITARILRYVWLFERCKNFLKFVTLCIWQIQTRTHILISNTTSWAIQGGFTKKLDWSVKTWAFKTLWKTRTPVRGRGVGSGIETQLYWYIAHHINSRYACGIVSDYSMSLQFCISIPPRRWSIIDLHSTQTWLLLIRNYSHIDSFERIGQNYWKISRRFYSIANDCMI